MGTYPIKERAKDAGINLAHVVFGTLHFTLRLTADLVREAEAQTVHLIDNGCELDLIRKQRDVKYKERIEDFVARVEESKRVMNETFHKVSTQELVIIDELLAPAPPVTE